MNSEGSEQDWLGRLVRILVVFRLLVLLATVATLIAKPSTAVTAAGIVVALASSYVPLRHWDKVGATVSRHPIYLTGEVLVSMVILGATGARSPFFYFTLGTAAIAGVLYGRRGVIPFGFVLVGLYEVVALVGFPALHPLHDAESLVFAPVLYPLAIAAGVAARTVIERGVRAEALLSERTRALATQQERMQVARELHDSLAKTVEGLAMTAAALPRRCERNPQAAAKLATSLAADARRGALEARALMSGLRTEQGGHLVDSLTARGQALGERAGTTVTVSCADASVTEGISDTTAHELLRIFAEAVINSINHGQAQAVDAVLEKAEAGVLMRIRDDGKGPDGDLDLKALEAAGHYGLVGMRERARSVGGELRLEAPSVGGLVVEVTVPVGPEGKTDQATAAAGLSEPSGNLVLARVLPDAWNWRQTS
ncbi:MAG: hypothetical protein J2O48_01900 [Solirubrobacterales bacterium]|nr:hypothetical protein [Solirubrobacterales bacterium]